MEITFLRNRIDSRYNSCETSDGEAAFVVVSAKGGPGRPTQACCRHAARVL
jgi:hypothetical protein